MNRQSSAAPSSDSCSASAVLDPSVIHRKKKRAIADASCPSKVVEDTPVELPPSAFISDFTKRLSVAPSHPEATSPLVAMNSTVHQAQVANNVTDSSMAVASDCRLGELDLGSILVENKTCTPFIPIQSNFATDQRSQAETNGIATLTNVAASTSSSSSSPLPPARRVSNSYLQQTISFLPTSASQSENTSSSSLLSRASPTNSPSRPAKQARANILSKSVTLPVGVSIGGEKVKTNTSLHAIRDLYRNASAANKASAVVDHAAYIAQGDIINADRPILVRQDGPSPNYAETGSGMSDHRTSSPTRKMTAAASVASNSAVTIPSTTAPSTLVNDHHKSRLIDQNIPARAISAPTGRAQQIEPVQSSQDAVGVSLYLPPSLKQMQTTVTASVQGKGIPAVKLLAKRLFKEVCSR